MAFEDNGKHWLRQLFESAVDQARERFSRTDNEKLSDACLEGNFGKVKSLISGKTANIEYRCPKSHNQTPLMIAVEWGNVYGEKSGQHEKIIAFLLAHNADPLHVDDLGRDIWSLAKGHERIMALLPIKLPSGPSGNNTPAPKP